MKNFIENLMAEAIEKGETVTRIYVPQTESSTVSSQTIDLAPSEYTVSTQAHLGQNFSVPMLQHDPGLCPPYRPEPCRAVGPAKLKLTNVSTWDGNTSIALQAKGSIELKSGFKALSAGLINAMGHNNAFDIYADDSRHIRIKFFMALVEHEAFSARQSNQVIARLLNNGFDLKEIDYEDRVPPIFWRLQRSDKNSSGFIDLVQTLLDCSELDALATLASILGLDLKYVFQNYNNGLYDQHGAPYRRHPYNLDSTDGTFSAKLQRECPILGYDGSEIAYIAEYRVYPEDVSFCVPVHYSEQGKSIGYYPIQAAILNQCQLNEIGTEHVLFCLDPRLAIELDATIQDCRIKIAPLPVVTGHIGTNLEALPWNFFYDKNVILIPAATPAAMSAIGAYHKYLDEADAASVEVCPFWLLPYERGTIEQPPALHNVVEEQLLNNAVFLPEVESITSLIRKILADSLPYEKYLAWGKKVGIFHESKTKTQNQHTKEPKSMDRLRNSGNVMTNVKASICDFFPRDGVCLIQGKKNSGKSMVVTMIATMLVSPTNTSIFGKNDNSCKVLLVDGESTERVLAQRIGGFGLIDHPNFGFIAQRMEDSDTTWAAMDLNSDLTRNILTKKILADEYDYVIIDNLTCLTKNAANYSPDFASVLFDWAAELNKRNIGVIFVNHLHDEDLKQTKDAKSRGSKELYIRAQTELRIIGKDEIMDDEALNEAFGLHIEDGFLVSGIHIKSCKNAPQEERTIRWVKHMISQESIMSLGTTDLKGNKINADRNEEPETVCLGKTGNQRIGVDINVDSLKGLTDNEKRILEVFIKRYNEGRTDPAPRSIFDHPDDQNTAETTRNGLNKLSDIGVVKIISVSKTKNNFQLTEDFQNKLKEYQDSISRTNMDGLQSEEEIPTS